MKKQQTITTLQKTLEGVMQEWINTKQELAEVRIELEETQEALRRNRNLLESYKMFESLFVATGEKLTLYYNKSKEYENMSVFTFIKNRIVKR